MHNTAYDNCKQFKNCYYSDIFTLNNNLKIVEIGSQNVNGSLRDHFPNTTYIGVDFVEGNGVDVILTDPYKLPFDNDSVDMVLCSSVFEHSEMFWVLYLEILRILKPYGLFYLNAPSNGDVHRWPVDCWRFYPDSGNALVSWAKRNDYNTALLESYISHQNLGFWNDFVAVFVKDQSYKDVYSNRILNSKTDFYNGLIDGQLPFLNYTEFTEDQKRLEIIRKIITGEISVNK